MNLPEPKAKAVWRRRSLMLWSTGLIAGLSIGLWGLENGATSLILLLVAMVGLFCFSPRTAGLGGLLLGQGAFWHWATLNVNKLCPATCSWYWHNEAHLSFGSFSLGLDWRFWIAFSLISTLFGLIFTAWAAYHGLTTTAPAAFGRFHLVYRLLIGLFFLFVVVITYLFWLGTTPVQY